MPLLQVDALSFSIATGHIVQGKKTILDQISFEVPRGAATAYLGTNGAGKTSTFRILSGLAQPDSGKLFFDGQEVKVGLPPQRFGFMPEQPYFYKNLTPNELLQGLGKISAMAAKDLTAAIPVWAEKLAFTHVLEQKLSTCSKGQVQRVGLAQALMHQPDFILLDEPLSGLDPLGRECVRQVIHDEIHRGATVLFSSHILSDAEAMCEHIIVLESGHIAFSGNIKTLLASETNWLIRATCPASLLDKFGNANIDRNVDGSWSIKGNSDQLRNTIIQHLLDEPEASLIAVEPKHRTLEQAFVELLHGHSQP